jgi:DNA-binding transcriptional LysR family regulator
VPLQLTFHHLAAVVAVADAGTFEGAGKLLGIAQSAVSKHVMDLEARYPFPLFDRSLRGARLTDGGIAVVEKARRLLKQRTALIDSFVAHSAIRRKVRVGITELTAQTWLPSFLHATKCRFPTVELEIEISSMASLLREKLIRADLEMVMFSDSVDLTGLQHWPLGELTSAW